MAPYAHRFTSTMLRLDGAGEAGPRGYITVVRPFEDLITIWAEIGMAFTPEKYTPPVMELVWLGFEISSVPMTTRIPTKMDEVLDDHLVHE